MIPKDLDHLTEQDLLALVEEQVREGLRLEYKLELPPGDEGKRALLKAVCSLANTQGGDLVVGVEVDSQDKALPVAVPGVPAPDPDGEVLRIHQIVRAGLEPQLEAPGVQPVPLKSGNYSFVVRVQQSWRRPHRDVHARHFYARHSAGAYNLDVQEVRRAFLMTEGQADRIRNFVADRLITIRGGDLPVPLEGKGRIVLHLIPLGALEPGSGILSPEDLRMSTSNLVMIADLPTTHTGQLTFDGLVRWLPVTSLSGDRYGSLVTLYRSGIIEAIDGYILGSPQPAIPGERLEQVIVRAVDSYRQVLANAEVPVPVYLFLNVWGLKGRSLAPPAMVAASGARRELIPREFQRDHLPFPEVVITNYGVQATELLSTTLDLLWNAVGFDRSPVR